MAAIPTFPLLGLPDKEILRTIRLMDLEEILKLSLITERCKNLVKSIRIKGAYFHVAIASSINIFINTNPVCIQLVFYREQNMYWEMGAYGRKKKLTVPQSVIVHEYERPIVPKSTISIWERNELTMQYWLKHLQDIFYYHKIWFINFTNNSSQFDIDDLKEVFGNVTEVHIETTGCYAFNQMILEKFSSIERLEIKPSNFSNSKIPERILMQNFAKVRIGDAMETTILSLDQLLLINIKEIFIEDIQMSAKELNKFIKLWQSGSNPRMEYATIYYTIRSESDIEGIMKGINHQEISNDQIRNFKVARNRYPKRVIGGIDIVRVDGVKATIQLMGHHLPRFEMYVWFDHCAMES